MIADTSQIASAAARASSPTLEDENTRCTVWSIPSKTCGRTFGSIAGPIVLRQSSCWWVTPRIPSPNSVHATAAISMRRAIALAYVRRLWRSKRSTQSRTICLKLRQRASTASAASPSLTTRKRGELVQAAEALLRERRRVEHLAARRRRDADMGSVVGDVHCHGESRRARQREAVGQGDPADETVLAYPDVLGHRLHLRDGASEQGARQALRLQRLGQVDAHAVVRRGGAVDPRGAELANLCSFGLEHREQVGRLELAAGQQLADVEPGGLAELRDIELDPLLAAGQLRGEGAELHVDDVVAVLLERDLLHRGVTELFTRGARQPGQPQERTELEAQLGARSLHYARPANPERLAVAGERHDEMDARGACGLRLRRSGRARIEGERVARAAAAATGSEECRSGNRDRGCDTCFATLEHVRSVVRPGDAEGVISSCREGGGDRDGRGSRPLRGAGRREEDWSADPSVGAPCTTRGGGIRISGLVRQRCANSAHDPTNHLGETYV